MSEIIEFGLYQSCKNRGNVGHVSVVVLWVVLAEWVGGLGQGLAGWCGVMYACIMSLDCLAGPHFCILY